MALLLGVVGVILGAFASYIEVQETLRRRASYVEFEKLAASDVVHQERKKCLLDNPPPGYAHEGSRPPVNEFGITGINWTQDCRAAMIYTDTGQVFYQELAPHAWEYLLIAVCPALGFFVPWGAVRAVGWVGVGFINGPK
jgi:hypothetical protein